MRLRVPAMRGQHAYFDRVSERLRAMPGIDQVDTNAATGSIIIAPGRFLEGLGAIAEDAALFTLAANHRDTVDEGLAQLGHDLDRHVRRLTQNALSLRTLAFLALLALALGQVRRGDILASAFTLTWYAAGLLVVPPRQLPA